MESTIKGGGITLMLMLSLLSAQYAHAQTFGEFFNQKKTQKRYLLQQIAALQVYLGYAKKGYLIVGSGLQTVKDITGGEFSLHSAFINSLKSVSPAIRKNVKIAQIIDKHLRIMDAFRLIRADNNLPISIREYIADVKETTFTSALADTQDLLMIITSGKVEMDDAERISRIDRIDESMSQRLGFSIYFLQQVQASIQQAATERQFLNRLKDIYEIK